jgi:hypothetical protein
MAGERATLPVDRSHCRGSADAGISNQQINGLLVVAGGHPSLNGVCICHITDFEVNLCTAGGAEITDMLKAIPITSPE